ncbi:MAG: DUF1579 family protein [Saprospiraceae bacterium]|nr:DUF1579 family protein [Saprospiraceae bacterium]
MEKVLFILLFLQSIFLNGQDNDPWTVYMSPAAVHELFAKYTGAFQLEIEMSGMNEPIKIGSMHQMILGGRFLELKQKGSMMGMDYEALSTIGFNTIDQTVSMTAITNMGTGTLALQGLWDEQTKTANLRGKLTNPVSKKTMNVRQTIQFADANTILIDNYDQEENHPERKTIQYKFVRK